MSTWYFLQCCKQDIIELENLDFYQRYGELALYLLRQLCTENFELVRYPTDEEFRDTIAKIKLREGDILYV